MCYDSMSVCPYMVTSGTLPRLRSDEGDVPVNYKHSSRWARICKTVLESPLTCPDTQTFACSLETLVSVPTTENTVRILPAARAVW